MNDQRNPAALSANDRASDFHWPRGAELGYICASALMPYLLACALLAS